eukprot:257950-Amphidinium_carterae.1
MSFVEHVERLARVSQAATAADAAVIWRIIEGTKLFLKHVVVNELSECEGPCLVQYCADTTPQ